MHKIGIIMSGGIYEEISREHVFEYCDLSKKQDLQFWLDKSPEERIDAVEFLRTQYYCLLGHKSVPRFVPVIQIRAQHS